MGSQRPQRRRSSTRVCGAAGRSSTRRHACVAARCPTRICLPRQRAHLPLPSRPTRALPSEAMPEDRRPESSESESVRGPPPRSSGPGGPCADRAILMAHAPDSGPPLRALPSRGAGAAGGCPRARPVCRQGRARCSHGTRPGCLRPGCAGPGRRLEGASFLRLLQPRVSACPPDLSGRVEVSCLLLAQALGLGRAAGLQECCSPQQRDRFLLY